MERVPGRDSVDRIHQKDPIMPSSRLIRLGLVGLLGASVALGACSSDGESTKDKVDSTVDDAKKDVKDAADDAKKWAMWGAIIGIVGSILIVVVYFVFAALIIGASATTSTY